MASDLDYYRILNVTHECTADEVRQQYLRLTILFHPDRNPGDEARCAEQLRQVKEAFEVLSDDKKRAKFDRSYQEMLAVKAYRAAPKSSGAYNTTEDGRTVYTPWRPANGNQPAVEQPQKPRARMTPLKIVAIVAILGAAAALGAAYLMQAGSTPPGHVWSGSSTAVVHPNRGHHEASRYSARSTFELGYGLRHKYASSASHTSHVRHSVDSPSQERANRLAEARLNDEFQQPRQEIQ
ncbi:MAG: J domain-containing protein [Capsulimonadaceae bacterium]